MKFWALVGFMLFSYAGFTQSSVYDYKVNAVAGGEIDFDNLRGKLIVVVNIASGSERSAQLRQLDTLCRSYADSGLVVIAFPSNDFNNEPKSNEDIQTWTADLHPNLLVATRTIVSGGSKSAFYQWCTQKSVNGVVDREVPGDYYKFIINKQGQLTGFFSGAVSPLAAPFIRAIQVSINQTGE